MRWCAALSRANRRSSRMTCAGMNPSELRGVSSIILSRLDWYAAHDPQDCVYPAQHVGGMGGTRVCYRQLRQMLAYSDHWPRWCVASPQHFTSLSSCYHTQTATWHPTSWPLAHLLRQFVPEAVQLLLLPAAGHLQLHARKPTHTYTPCQQRNMIVSMSTFNNAVPHDRKHVHLPNLIAFSLRDWGTPGDRPYVHHTLIMCSWPAG